MPNSHSATVIQALILISILRFGETAMGEQGSYCGVSKYKGISFRDNIPFFCCNGTQIHNKGRMFTVEESIGMYRPCKKEVHEQFNENTETPADLMWKIEGCVLLKKLEITEDKLTYSKFVEFMTSEYTKINGVQSMIVDTSKDCTEAEAETEFFKKYRAMDQCFFSNVEKQCTSADKLAIILANDKINKKNASSGCPHVPGVNLQCYYCCQNETLPGPLVAPFLVQTFLAEEDVEKSDKCIKNVFAYALKNKVAFKGSCVEACSLNPVIFDFTEGAVMPDFDWKRNETIDELMMAVNITSVRKGMKDIYERIKDELKFSTSRAQAQSKSGVPLSDVEKNYKNATSTIDKVQIYCSYYNVLNNIVKGVFAEYCTNSDARKKLFAINGIF